MAADDRFHVPAWLDVLGHLTERWPEPWVRLGDHETRWLRDRMPAGDLDRPIYVAGLARAGSTVLLELLAGHRDVATHRYRDFPMVHIPWLWNRFVDAAVRSPESGEGQERAHGDGIRVTAESPEAFEEVIWTTFFRNLHDPTVSNVLDRDTANPAFEAFYRDHLRKLLVLRDGRRYLAKGNYNVTRLGYLHRLFPDARFVVPVRDPVGHVASLMRQHVRFEQVGHAHPRARRYMRRAGHFEFGPDLRPINVGDDGAVARIRRLWAAGDTVDAWARYWATIYDHIAGRLDSDPHLRAATIVVRFEDMCLTPAETMARIQDHIGLPGDDLPRLAAARLRAPDYYRPPFTAADEALIRDRTAATASRFGYAGPTAPVMAGAAS